MISVVVCTYNRAEILEGALKTLQDQTVEPSRFEIIVVDNNSTDKTPHVVRKRREIMGNLKYCFEPEQGLSRARNRGWKEARGDYVAFVDDDCRMPKEWLRRAFEVIEESAPGAFGGPYSPWYETPPPEWVKEGYFSTLNKGTSLRNLVDGEFLDGGNFIVRRNILEHLGGFDPKLGMKGKSIGVGEETLLQINLRNSFPDERIIFDPSLEVEHMVRTNKMTMGWVLNHRFQSGRYSHRTFDHMPNEGEMSTPPAFMKLAYHVVRFIGALVFGLLFRNRKQYPFIQNYLYEDAFYHVYIIGDAWEKFRK